MKERNENLAPTPAWSPTDTTEGGTLIERLRTWQAWVPDGYSVKPVICIEAAGRIEQLERELERECHSHSETIGARDYFEEAIQDIHIALGGDGEWVAKLPPEEPPDSGDLARDALVLAEDMTERAEKAEAALKEFVRIDEEAGLFVVEGAASDLVLALDAARNALASSQGKPQDVSPQN